jgi:hypothetical protein
MPLAVPEQPGARPNETMGIDEGIETLNHCWSNGYTIFARMSNSYLIRQIRPLS